MDYKVNIANETMKGLTMIDASNRFIHKLSDSFIFCFRFVNVKVLLGYIPTSNAKSLACDTANEHALERHAAAVRQLSNGTNSDDLYIHIAMVWNTIQTVNSPMYDTHMSTLGNTAKLGTAHSNIQTAQSSPSLVGSEPTIH